MFDTPGGGGRGTKEDRGVCPTGGGGESNVGDLGSMVFVEGCGGEAPIGGGGDIGGGGAGGEPPGGGGEGDLFGGRGRTGGGGEGVEAGGGDVFVGGDDGGGDDGGGDDGGGNGGDGAGEDGGGDGGGDDADGGDDGIDEVEGGGENDEFVVLLPNESGGGVLESGDRAVTVAIPKMNFQLRYINVKTHAGNSTPP